MSELATPAGSVSARALAALRSAGSHPIVAGFPDGAVLVFDHDLRYLSAGGLGLTEVGLSPQMLEGHTIFEVFPPEVVALIEPLYRAALAGDHAKVGVSYGGPIFVQRLAPLRDDNGTVVAGMGFSQDVTAAPRGEGEGEQLRASEERYLSAFDHAPIGQALIGLDGRYLQVNPALCALTGYSEDQMRGRSMADLVHPEDLPRDQAAMDRLLRGEQTSYTVDNRYRTPTGGLGWGAKSVSLVRRDDGTPVHFIAQIQDISDRKTTELALVEERRRLHEAESAGRVGSWEVDLDSGAVTWSDAMLELRGLTRADFRGDYAAALQFVHPDDRAPVADALAACSATGEAILVRYRVTRADTGALRWVDTRGSGIRHDGRLVRIVGTVVDVTDDVLAAEQARDAHAFQEAVISASPDIIFVYDIAAGSTVWTNRSLSDTLGYRPDDPGNADDHAARGGDVIAGYVPPGDLDGFTAALTAACTIADGDVVQDDHRLTQADGSIRWFSRRTTPLRRDAHGRVTQIVGVLRDITDTISVQNRLTHVALHDTLTGLPNRVLLADRLEGALVRSGHDRREISVLFCDLDGFKRINDIAGHAAGDAVLQETTRRLHAALRDGDTVARVGGDEFVVIIEPWNRPPDDRGGNLQPDDRPGTDLPAVALPPPDRADRAVARRIAERILAALRVPVVVRGVEHTVTASIGIAYGGLPTAGGEARTATAEEILQNADAAMYHAKHQGRDRVEVFDPGMRADLAERGRVEHVLRRALHPAPPRPAAGDPATPDATTGRLSAVYQPIFDARTGHLVGFEALARLTDPAGATIPPDVFITIAEDTGLIRPLGTVMLDLACGQLAAWRAATPGLADITMAVNISALQAQHTSLDDDVRAALRRHQLTPHDLVLELTETALLQATPATITTLRTLHDEGLGIAIDDFGTGYASLRYLATLPVSALKVDRSFTAGVSFDETSRKIVYAVAGLAADMDLACIIEGVETPAQRAALPDGVELQGYLTGRPQHPDNLDLPGLITHGAP